MEAGVVTERPLRTLGAATLSNTVGALPIFLVGALAVFIRPELGFGESGLGALATVYYLASAVSSLPAGPVADRLGSRKAMALAAAVCLLAMVGIALFADRWWSLALLLALAGVGNGIAFPASSRALSTGIPPHRRGLAFGIKQSAGPYATLLAGASVPLIGLTVGWRWAFVAAGLAALPVIVRARTSASDVHVTAGGEIPAVRPVWLLSAAAFLGVSATASLGAFYVESAVSHGVSPGVAGTMLSAGSLIGIGARMAWGWLADGRTNAHFRLSAGLLGVGGLSFVLLDRPGSAIALLAVTVLVFATGWGWPSVLAFGVLHRNPQAPGRASGILGTGQFGGGILGPLVFGIVVERSGYGVAWTLAGSMLVAAAALVLYGGRALEQTGHLAGVGGG